MLGQIFMTAVNAVVPIVLLIVAGYLLRRVGLMTQEFAKVGNALVFKLGLPCTLFVNVYEIRDLGAMPWTAMIYCVVMICVIVGLGLVAAVAGTNDLRRRGVIWQASFRSNFAIIGITLSAALGGQSTSAFAALVSALAIPLFNIFAVIALSVFTSGEEKGGSSAKKLLLDIIKNPLIIGVAAGLACLGVRALQERLLGQVVFALDADAKFLYSAFGSIKSMTTPLALLVLGAQFEFSAVKGMAREITVGTLMRIVVAPLVGVGGAVLLSRYTQLSVGQAELPGMLALFGSPVAVSSAIMAEQMGNDGQLASQLVVWTSIGSIVTIFVFSCVLMSLGLISV